MTTEIERRNAATRWEGGNVRITVTGNFFQYGPGSSAGVIFLEDNTTLPVKWATLFSFNAPGHRDITLPPGWIEVKLGDPSAGNGPYPGRTMNFTVEAAPTPTGHPSLEARVRALEQRVTALET